MEQLRDDRDGLAVLCDQAAVWFSAARATNVPAVVIEKDFWVTEVLRLMSTPLNLPAPNADVPGVTVRAIFKGGTSLSKAWGIIQRFSEDIDVFVQIDAADDTGAVSAGPKSPVGKSRADSVMRSLAASVAASLGLPEPSPVGSATTGTKRAFQITYTPRGRSQGGLLKEGVKLELVRLGRATPTSEPELHSMLHTWAAATGTLATDEYAELRPFHMPVLAPERTLVDKLCILHRLSVEVAAGEDALANQARHYYDVAQLLGNRSVIDSLASQPDLVRDYAADADADSRAARRRSHPRPAGGFADSPAFKDAEVLASARAHYDEEMAALRLGPVPDFDAAVATVLAHRHHI